MKTIFNFVLDLIHTAFLVLVGVALGTFLSIYLAYGVSL